MYLQNKYTRWYYRIIQKAQTRVLPDDAHIEKHHIVPRSLGGNNSKLNIANLTPREHFVCHLLLTKMTEGNNLYKMRHALGMITNIKRIGQGRYVPSSRIYEYVRKCCVEAYKVSWTEEKRKLHSEKLKAYNATLDRTTEEYKTRIEKAREKHRNKVWTEKAIQTRLDNCIKSAKARKGKPWTEGRRQTYLDKPIKMSNESNEKRRNTLKGRKTSIGYCKGFWFKSPDKKEVLFYPFKITAKTLDLSTFRLKKLMKIPAYEYNGWEYIRPATKEEVEKTLYSPTRTHK